MRVSVLTKEGKIVTGEFMPELPLENPMVLITKQEYDSLKEDEMWLACLNDAGVDNWSGVSYAYELMDQEIEG